MANEDQHAHDDITTQLVESIGLDNAIMALSRLCDRNAKRADTDGSECLAFVYRSLGHQLWATAQCLESRDLVDRWKRITATETSQGF